MKKILQLTLSLTLISAICAAVLALVNSRTESIIKQLKADMEVRAAKAVLPSGVAAIDVRSDPSNATFKVSFGYADADKTKLLGYAVPGRSKGFGGDILLMVGLTPDRKIVTYKKLAATETPGLGAKLGDEQFTKQFGGKVGSSLKVKKEGGEIDAITGATITSRAVCDAIKDACARIDRVEGTAGSPAVQQ